MYQEDIKKEFIDCYLKDHRLQRTSINALFKNVAPYEEENDVDCSGFTVEQIIRMYKAFNAKTAGSLANYNTILKAYAKWREPDKEYCSYDNITSDDLHPCVTHSGLLTRQEVTDIENALYNWTDKAIVECLWEGISGNSMLDLVSINAEMLDEENKRLSFPDGRNIQLTDKLIGLLKYAFDETEYVSYGTTGKAFELNGKGNLYKERNNAHAHDSEDKYFRWVYRKIDLYRNHVGLKKFTMKNISTSGMYYYLKMGMAQTCMSMKDYLQSNAGVELMGKYGYTSGIDNVLRQYKQLDK